MADISIIAGGAGFIGSNLALSLVQSGRRVAVIDDLSYGKRQYLDGHAVLADVPIIVADLSDRSACEAAFDAVANLGPIGDVWHMAANSDIPAGVSDPDVDLKRTFLTTYEMLRSMRRLGIASLHFASSSAIYGDLGEKALHEEIGPLFPISNYGAMKLASEAQLSAAAESFLRTVNVFRFPNVVGVPATHGVILDFVNKLKRNPEQLEVLGDGTQKKAYLHVSDLVSAMRLIAERDNVGIAAINIGPTDDGITVREIAEAVVAQVSPNASICFGEGNKGWVGDVPRFVYSTSLLQSFGWSPRLGSADAVCRAIQEIAKQQGF